MCSGSRGRHDPKGEERRRDPRADLNLLVRVEGYEADRTRWHELTTSLDASAGGLSLPVKRPLVVGQVLKLQLMLPSSKLLLRSGGEGPHYGVYAIVRDTTLENGVYRVGAMFFGESPPQGFESNPAALYLLPCDVSPEGWPGPPPPRDRAESPAPRDRRGTERFDISVNFLAQQVDEWEGILQEGLTVTENLSQGGARLLTAASVRKGDILILREVGGGFVTRAEVTNLYADEDGTRHLHVRFLGEGPEHLVPGR